MSPSSDTLDWLPPSADPIVPEDVRPDHPAWYVPPRLPQPGESRFFIMKQGLKPLIKYGWRTDDKPIDSFARDSNGEFFPITKISDRPMPKKLNDVVGGFPWLVTRRIFEILLEFDPGALEWRPMTAKFKDDELEFYFIKSSRRIHAIDFANTKSLFRQSEGYDPYPALCGPARMLTSIPSEFHIFADIRKRTQIFVSSAIRDRIISLDPPPYNAAFYDPAENSFTF